MIRETYENEEAEFCLTLWLLGKSSKSKNTPTDHPHCSLHVILEEKDLLPHYRYSPWGHGGVTSWREGGDTGRRSASGTG
jgi:hypothetical protein